MLVLLLIFFIPKTFAFASESLFLYASYNPKPSNKIIFINQTGGIEKPIIEYQIVDNTMLAINQFLFENQLIKNDELGFRNQIDIYTIKQGDTLSLIAARFGLRIDTLLWANNLTIRDTISIGDKLKILPIDGIRYIVKEGDAISSIAELYSGAPEDIIEFNNLERNGFIVKGQLLIIPGGKPELKTKSRSDFYVSDFLPKIIGQFTNPLPGARLSQGLHYNNAVDLANICGSNVLAAMDGIVSIADDVGWNGGFGQYIIINHDNRIRTAYGHLSKILVIQGQEVLSGQTIALVGNTGYSTGCHTHFEVRGVENPFGNY